MSDQVSIRRKTADLQNATAKAVAYLKSANRKKLFLPKSFFLMLHKELLAYKSKEAGCYRDARHILEIPKKTFEPAPAWRIEDRVLELLDFINNRRRWYSKFRTYFLNKEKRKLSKQEKNVAFKVFLPWYIHHKFVVIHPFSDGNGRTARLLMCLILRHEGIYYMSYPALINKIINEDKNKYLDALNSADKGDYVSGLYYMMSVLTKSYNVTREAEKKYLKEKNK